MLSAWEMYPLTERSNLMSSNSGGRCRLFLNNKLYLEGILGRCGFGHKYRDKAGKMAQQLRLLTTSYNYSFRGSSTLFWCVVTHTP